MAESQAQTAEIIKALAELQAIGAASIKSVLFRAINGGIWQIDPIGLEDVQKNLRQDKKAALLRKFGVDVDELNRDHGDLIDVRTGAAVARALVYRKPEKNPEDDDGQAAYWLWTL